MKKRLCILCLIGGMVLLFSAFTPSKKSFTAAEQQQISIATPSLFARGNSFQVDFRSLQSDAWSFPLPVGTARSSGAYVVDIATRKGDAVKAVFNGTVRLSRKTSSMGNTLVIRHENGLETVYGNNAQNLVQVGQTVRAGQTIAIVGTKDGKAGCTFSIMVNGAKINPEMIFDLGTHQLKKQVLVCRRSGHRISVSVVPEKSSSMVGIQAKVATSLDPDEEIAYDKGCAFQLNLSNIGKAHWSYPLPGSHVISPYGGKRHHAGVDIKTCPNDKVLAAFDGVVTRSGPYFGYGNCIVIKHAYGLETLYSHQSKNLVRVGQRVQAGQVIGLTGRTGRATTEHLHFEVHCHGHRVNPALLFDHTNKSLQQSTLTLEGSGKVRAAKNLFAQGRN